MAYSTADRTMLTRVDATTQSLAGGFQQQIADLTAQVSTLTDDLAKSQAMEKADQATIADLQGQLTAAEGKIAELTQELADCEAQHDPPAARFPGDPGAGVLYFGESRDGGDPSARESYFGHPVGVYRSYFVASDSAATVAARAQRDVTAKRLPFVSTKLPGTWADVAAGKFDSWLSALLASLGNVAGPVWLCLHHEPWDDQGAGQTSADYRAMYQHAATLKPANVALVPILQTAPFDPTVYGKQTDFADWYALDVIDAVGIDDYCHWFPGGGNKWRDVPTVMQFFDTAAKLGKPLALAEWGVRTDPANPGKAAQWMTDFKAALVARGDVVAASYFDSAQNVNDGGTPWTLDYSGNRERLDAFKALLPATGSAFLT